jgi:hypothetical protein
VRADAEVDIRPQRRHADIVIAFLPGDRGERELLDARVTMRPGLVHPDPSALADGDVDGLSLHTRGPETSLQIRGRSGRPAARRFRRRCGTACTSPATCGPSAWASSPSPPSCIDRESLAITRLLVLYQLVTARAAVAVGAEGARTGFAATTAGAL